MNQNLDDSDKERIKWCIATIREIANLGRDQPLGDLYRDAVTVVTTLKKVLEPNV